MLEQSKNLKAGEIVPNKTTFYRRVLYFALLSFILLQILIIWLPDFYIAQQISFYVSVFSILLSAMTKMELLINNENKKFKINCLIVVFIVIMILIIVSIYDYKVIEELMNYSEKGLFLLISIALLVIDLIVEDIKDIDEQIDSESRNMEETLKDKETILKDKETILYLKQNELEGRGNKEDEKKI